MARISKIILPVLILIGGISPSNAWWDPNSVTDISTTNLYGITTAMKTEDPKQEKVGLIATRGISADRAVVLVGTGGSPWWSGPFGLFLVDQYSGTLVRKIATVDSIDPQNTMPELKAAGPGFATITHEDVDTGGELARRKYFFDETSTATATALSYKPIRISSIARFKNGLFFAGLRGANGIIIRLGLKNEVPAPDDWEVVDEIGAKPLSPVSLSKAGGDTLNMYTPSETYSFNGKNWTRLPGPDPRYFRPQKDPCSAFSTDEFMKDFSVYEKCDKERYVQGDAALVGYEGRCETENPGKYAWLHKSYTGILERHAISDRLIDISKAPLRRFFVWNSAAGYEAVTGIYDIRGNSCKFYPVMKRTLIMARLMKDCIDNNIDKGQIYINNISIQPLRLRSWGARPPQGGLCF